MAVAYAFGGDQCALGIQAVEDVFEAFAFFADKVLGGNFQVVEEQLVRFMIDHVGNGDDFHAFSYGLMQVDRSEEHTSELQSLMRISYAVFCLKKKNKKA